MNFAYRLIIFFALRCLTLRADVLPKTCAEEQVLDLLAKWRNGDIVSPSLDVIELKSIESFYEGFGIKITYITGDMQLTGASKFVVEELSVSANKSEGTMAASTTVHFPQLTLTADQYNLKGRAYLMYSLKGTGLMNVTFHDVDVTLKIFLVPKGTATQVDDISLEFTVNNIQVNLADSSWPINKVLNSNALNIVEKYRSTFVMAAKDMIKKILNEYLATITPAQLLSINKNQCSKSLS